MVRTAAPAVPGYRVNCPAASRGSPSRAPKTTPKAGTATGLPRRGRSTTPGTVVVAGRGTDRGSFEMMCPPHRLPRQPPVRPGLAGQPGRPRRRDPGPDGPGRRRRSTCRLAPRARGRSGRLRPGVYERLPARAKGRLAEAAGAWRHILEYAEAHNWELTAHMAHRCSSASYQPPLWGRRRRARRDKLVTGPGGQPPYCRRRHRRWLAAIPEGPARRLGSGTAAHLWDQEDMRSSSVRKPDRIDVICLQQRAWPD